MATQVFPKYDLTGPDSFVPEIWVCPISFRQKCIQPTTCRSIWCNPVIKKLIISTTTKKLRVNLHFILITMYVCNSLMFHFI